MEAEEKDATQSADVANPETVLDDANAAAGPGPPTRSDDPVQLAPQRSREAGGNELSFRAVEPVNVCVRHLSVAVGTPPTALEKLGATFARKQSQLRQRPSSKCILDDVSADMQCGTLTAIIGGSGSGKTSMLNVMAGRMRGSRLELSGRTTFNNAEDFGSVRSAYVMQQDVLIPTLTVRETLRYAANLRLPPSVSAEERRLVVEEVIVELGLKEAADTRIGNDTHKGCSGGEKRRTSIGVQLLANPSVLFLDEPTTGLDATSAFQLVRTLKNLARKGRTIITTIHQPRSEIWSLFDNTILLTKGRPAYSGPAQQCLEYFAELGYELPPFVNPAEYFIDVVAVDTRTPEQEEESSSRVESIVQSWRRHVSENLQDRATEKTAGASRTGADGAINNGRAPTNAHAGIIRQIRFLTTRTWVVTIRDPMGMLGSLFEAVTLAVITGWIFYQLDGSQAGIRSRQGALYTAAALQGYLILLFETYRLCDDIQVFDRERGEGIVGVPAFLISRRLARIFIEDVPVPLIFSLIFYFMSGFRADGPQFLTFFGIVLLEQYIAVCFAMLCIAVSRDFAGASLVANLAYTLQSMACGYFVQANTIPVYTRWTKWIAYVYYAFTALCSNEFGDHFYDCPLPGGRSNEECRPYTGAFVLTSLGIPEDWTWKPVVVLLGWVVAFYLGAAVLLATWQVEMQISRQRNSDSDDSAGKEKMQARSAEEVREVDIRLDQYSLGIDKRKWWGSKSRDILILHPVSTLFEPGVLNVIMGPSGSGKTSLLNSMANRLRDDFTTRYKSDGKMLFNGAEPSKEVIKSLCSFVTQDDDALLPSLTVRETLRFAAGLRLPKWMSKEEKIRRAEEVLLQMGLKDCANTLIGGELVKGISGGEKRRVSIAVQILTDPRVLLLDEPTSGLDAFTASSIVSVLLSLASQRRTLILTIHQSRSDLFNQFGNVLLLARGGHPVYAGLGSQMLPHFANQGYKCPTTTNPADFALDLITVNLQREDEEQASRAKVNGLIELWSSGTQSGQVPSGTTTTANRATIATPAELGSLLRRPLPFLRALPILLHRSTINIRRQPPVILARTMQSFGLALILSLYFAPLKNDYASIQNRLGFVQEVGPVYFIGMLQNVAVYPAEAASFAREHADGAVTPLGFLAQYTLLETPFDAVAALLFAVLADLAVGLPRTVEVYFVVAYNAFCVISCGESLGIAFNTLFPHTGFAVNVTSVFLSVAQIMAGVMSLDIPPFLQAWNYLSPVKYAVGNLAPYALRGVVFDCAPEQQVGDPGRCPFETGEDVLRLYGLERDVRVQIAALGACVVAYRLVAFAVVVVVAEGWGGRAWRVVRRAFGRRAGR